MSSAAFAFRHEPGTAIECLSVGVLCNVRYDSSALQLSFVQIPITLTKEPEVDSDGVESMKCGFKIGGGIDQDFRRSPHGYSDSGVYVTDIHEESPASKAGLRVHDKILQCNGYD